MSYVKFTRFHVGVLNNCVSALYRVETGFYQGWFVVQVRKCFSHVLSKSLYYSSLVLSVLTPRIYIHRLQQRLSAGAQLDKKTSDIPLPIQVGIKLISLFCLQKNRFVRTSKIKKSAPSLVDFRYGIHKLLSFQTYFDSEYLPILSL